MNVKASCVLCLLSPVILIWKAIAIPEEIKKHFTEEKKKKKEKASYIQKSKVNFQKRQQRLVEITPKAELSCFASIVASGKLFNLFGF